MKSSTILLALIIGTLTCAHAADKSRVVDLAGLDQPPERLEFRPVSISEALKKSGIDDTVTMSAIISTEGKVERIENVTAANPESSAAATEAVKKWVFNRGFSAGQPVAYRLPVTIAIRPAQVSDAIADAGESFGGGGFTVSTAEVEFETIPEYPEGLKATPIEGRAMVNLLVDAEGKPGDAVVEFSSRPEFAAPAAAAVLEWAFSPAVRGGKPSAARTTCEVVFPAASAAWSAPERELQGQLKYARNYDEGPREKSSVPVVFPYEALLAGRQDTITLNVIVAPDGVVAKATPGPGADPDGVATARASLAGWTFFPATKAGRPVFGLITMQFTFDPHREEFQYDDSTFALIDGLRDGTAAILSLKNVDQMPKPVKQVGPILSLDHLGPTAGEAMIEFVIDKDGRAQLPRVVRSTSPELGWAAATAVAQWRFDPARKAGEPVACRARQLLKFAGEPAPAAP